MVKIGTEWVAPMLVIVAILAIWLFIYYLPSDIFGVQWATFKDSLWLYLPWLILFAIALYVLKNLMRR